MLVGCTRAAVPVQSLPTPFRPTSTPVVPTATSAEAATPNNEEGSEYAVVGIAEDGQLPVRATAGLSGLVNGYLTPQQRGLRLSGKVTLLGSSQWVEIVRADGRTGWVQANKLTEFIPPEQFCGDAGANEIVSNLTQAIHDRDGDNIASLVSESRGLLIRVDWWNPEVHFTKEQVADIFADPTPIDWGAHFASNTRITGSFSEAVLPQLDDALTPASALSCDELQIGKIVQDIQRPVVYANYNFYDIYRPAPARGNEFNWRSWSILIEYIDGRPYLVGLVQYRPQV